jgi:hypothetical protein
MGGMARRGARRMRRPIVEKRKKELRPRRRAADQNQPENDSDRAPE